MDTLSPIPGQRFTRNGIRFDVHEVSNGEVYGRRWPVGVENQPMFQNLVRVPLDVFQRDAATANREDEPA